MDLGDGGDAQPSNSFNFGNPNPNPSTGFQGGASNRPTSNPFAAGGQNDELSGNISLDNSAQPTGAQKVPFDPSAHGAQPQPGIFNPATTFNSAPKTDNYQYDPDNEPPLLEGTY